MAKPYDVTLKMLVESHPADWLAFAKLPFAGSAQVIDADLSTISPAADKVIRVDAAEPFIAHLEFQSSLDVELDRRMLMYHALLQHKHGLPVRSVLFLLRPEAGSPKISGGIREAHDADMYLDFRYRKIELWEQPVDVLLKGGLGTLPLAPIGNVQLEQLPDVISQIERRLATEASAAEAKESWTATYILMGLRYSPEVGRALLSGVRQMKESTTYQAILAEGEAKGEVIGRVSEARSLLLRLGTRHFGAPAIEIIRQIESIPDLARLESLIERTFDADSWSDLLSQAN